MARARPRDPRDRRLGGRRRACGPHRAQAPSAPPVDWADRRASPHREPSDAPPARAGGRVPGLERRRAGRVARRELPRAELGRRAVRRHRPRGVLRLPGSPPARAPRGGRDADDRLAGERLLQRRGARERTATRSSSSASSRTRAGGRSPRRSPALARRARRRAGRHARRAARGRPAHASGAGHRLGERPCARRGAWAQLVALRGPDRDRRRPPRRLPHRRAALGEPLGGGPALRLAGGEPEGRARALGAARRAARDRRSTSPTSSGPPRPTSSRSARRSPRTRRPRRTSTSSRPARDALGEELDVPSGDTLAAELTRFLKEHEERSRELDDEQGQKPP